MVSICRKRSMVTIMVMDDTENMDDMVQENTESMVHMETMVVLVTTVTANMEIRTIIL